MPFTLDVQPYPLGLIVPVAPGTPIAITSTITRAHTVSFQAWQANGGNVYIGRSNMVKATGVGVIWVLMGAGDSKEFTTKELGVIDPRTLFIDVDVPGEGALCSVMSR